MKRVMVSLIMISAVSVTAFSFSNAFFSDEEKSQGNTFQAGDIDLKIDNTSYYNGKLHQETTFDPVDLNGDAYRFFNFTDIKPSDWGADAISLHVNTNDAWACYNVAITANDDVSSNEPELGDGDTENDVGNLFDGELAQAVNLAVWQDDGDSVLENTETVLAQGKIHTVVPLLQGALADSQGGLFGNTPLSGSETYYVAKAWCFGDMTLSPLSQDTTGPDVRPGFITCNGANLDNITQTDQVLGDITFSAVQSRNNANYTCPGTECSFEENNYLVSVVQANQGDRKNGTDVLPARSNPNTALGAPQGTNLDGTFYSLGFGGSLTVAFDNPVEDLPGPDLFFREATNLPYPAEVVEIFVSQDNVTYVSLGLLDNTGNITKSLNLTASGLPWIKYVKLVDKTNPAIHDASADGYDVDGIEANNYNVCVL